MNQYPTVSIVMPTFNSARFIEASIGSVIRQDYREWELLVVDGGSNDITCEIVARYVASDHRIRLLSNSNDKGPAHARSTGVRQSRGEYIAFLDCDDLWLSTKLSTQIEFMHRSGSEFTYTKYMVMDSSGTMASCPVRVPRFVNYPRYLFQRGIACSTVIVCRKLFDEDILTAYGSWLAEDTHWWLMMLRNGVTACAVLEPLVLYRDSDGSLSKQRLRNQNSVWNIYRIYFKLPLPIAIASYVLYVLDVAFRRSQYRICTKLLGYKIVEEILS